MAERFFFDQDNSSHWYLVPLARKAEWDAWCSLDEDDEESWNAPEWAKPLGGGVHGFTFTDPQERAR